MPTLVRLQMADVEFGLKSEEAAETPSLALELGHPPTAERVEQRDSDAQSAAAHGASPASDGETVDQDEAVKQRVQDAQRARTALKSWWATDQLVDGRGPHPRPRVQRALAPRTPRYRTPAQARDTLREATIA